MEMIIQNETGNFTLHVRISDSKEYDFLKDVTELARKYDFKNVPAPKVPPFQVRCIGM